MLGHVVSNSFLGRGHRGAALEIVGEHSVSASDGGLRIELGSMGQLAALGDSAVDESVAETQADQDTGGELPIEQAAIEESELMEASTGTSAVPATPME